MLHFVIYGAPHTLVPGRQDIHVVPYKINSSLHFVATLVEEHSIALVGHFTQALSTIQDPVSHAEIAVALVHIVARDGHFVQVFPDGKYPSKHPVYAVAEQVLAPVPQAVQDLVVVSRKYPSIQVLASVSLVHIRPPVPQAAQAPFYMKNDKLQAVA